MDLTGKTELFVDTFSIDDLGAARLCLNHPEQREIVFTAKEPWESDASFVYSNLVEVDGMLRLYYRGTPQTGMNDYSEEQVCCVAVSGDGVYFERPAFGVLEFDGSRDNNIVFSGATAHNFSPFYDENPACSSDERFKAVCGFMQTGLFLYVSGDGICWRKKQEEPIISDGTFDSLNVLFYDTVLGAYRCYYRYFKNDADDRGKFEGIRAIASKTSKDLIHWSESSENAYAENAPREQFYTNNVVLCPGAEHILLSFPMRFVENRRKVPEYPKGGAICDNVFMTSRDGVYWDRSFVEAWVTPSMDRRCWTQRNYNPARGIFVKDEVMNFYVTEHYQWDDCHMRRYTLPLHRFASVRGEYQGATVITKPFFAAANTLLLNYATSAAGDVSVAVLDENKRAIEGYGFEECGDIYGNELAYEVMWNEKHFAALSNKKIRLAFRLKEADLYAFTLK